MSSFESQRPEPSHASPPQEVRYVYAAPPPPRGGCLGRVVRFAFTLVFLGVLAMIGYGLVYGVMPGGGAVLPSFYRAGLGDRIAIIPVEGIIGDNTTRFIHAVVDSILADKSIKAVVLRVESPGGGASASDQILHELSRLKGERSLPVIASYGGYAASGGYYVSCQADTIFAEPTTVTGSIGVISSVPTVQTLLQEKLGVKMEVITATDAPLKEKANTYYRDWKEEDRAVMRRLLDAIHERFTEVVYQGRQKILTREQVQGVAQGQVFTAKEAKAAGLIDEIGYLDAALESARAAGGFSEARPPVVIYHPRRTLADALGIPGLMHTAPPASENWKEILSELAVPRIEMLFHP